MIFKLNNNKITKSKNALKSTLLKTKSEKLLTLFNAKFNGTSLYAPIKPTLSPKDPNFPAWWEEHKAEWEEPKKEGQEPADD